MVFTRSFGPFGMVGTVAATQAKPDGYTLMITADSAQVIHPFLYQRTVFDPVKDFEPVALLAPAGKLKVLGVVHEKRVPALPDAPTIGETVKGFGATPWYGMLAPACTPKELIQFVQNEVSKAVGSADARDRLATLGCEPFKGTSEQLASIVRDGLVPWSRTVKESGAKLD